MTDLDATLDLTSLFGVTGKRVVVTGGATGIGYMIAAGFVTNGARVMITGRRVDRCRAAAAALAETGACIAAPSDVTTGAGRDSLRAAAESELGGVDVLVNNAGAARNAEFEAFDEDDLDLVLSTNLSAPFLVTRDLLPMLRRAASAADPARVINIGSNDGLRTPLPVQNGYAYGASKAAVHHLTRMLALRYGPEHITVNAIAPGPFPSEMMDETLAHFGELIEQACPMRRIGRPADMAGAALFLASAAGSYVNGVVLAVDGGNAV